VAGGLSRRLRRAPSHRERCPGGTPENSPTFQPEKCVTAMFKARKRPKNRDLADGLTYKIVQFCVPTVSGHRPCYALDCHLPRPSRRIPDHRPRRTYRIGQTPLLFGAAQKPAIKRRRLYFQSLVLNPSITKEASHAEPITTQNVTFLARRQTATFFRENKPFNRIASTGDAFFRLKRWAIVECPSGTNPGL
jgi:hypothetical protein